VPIIVASTVPYFTTCRYLQLPPFYKPVVIGFAPDLAARPGKPPEHDSQVRLPTFQNAKRPSVLRIPSQFFSRAESLRCNCKRFEILRRSTR